MGFFELFHLIVRWAHFVSAAAWVGGSLFWLFVLKPAAENKKLKDETFMRETAAEFRSTVDTCIFVLLATGAVMTFNRLTPGDVGVTYVAILGAKIAVDAIMFYLIRARRHRLIGGSVSTPTGKSSLFSIRILRMLTGYNLVVVLGLLVFLLSNLLQYVYNYTTG